MRSPLYGAAARLNAELRIHHGWWAAERFGAVEEDETDLLHGVALADLSAAGKIAIHGREAGSLLSRLGVGEPAIGRSAPVDGGRIYRLRADQFFATTGPDGTESMIEALETARAAGDAFVTVTDMTHGRAQLGLFGPHAPELLSRLCGLDFSDAAFPDGAALASSVAKTTQLIVRHDVGGPTGTVTGFSVIGARSLGDYLWQTVLAAGRDFGVRPMGWRAASQLMGWPAD
jgi:heterotetrameric sarcosine oxidase gamma subunit